MHVLRLLAATAIVAPLSLFGWQTARAAPITETLAVEVVFGPGAGERGTMNVTYDSEAITGTGDEVLSAVEFQLVMTLFGQTFTGEDDVDFPGFPELRFSDGTIAFIDFIIDEAGTVNPTPIDDPRIGRISAWDLVDGVWTASTTEPEAEPVKPSGSWRYVLYRNAM